MPPTPPVPPTPVPLPPVPLPPVPLPPVARLPATGPAPLVAAGAPALALPAPAPLAPPPAVPAPLGVLLHATLAQQVRAPSAAPARIEVTAWSSPKFFMRSPVWIWRACGARAPLARANP